MDSREIIVDFASKFTSLTRGVINALLASYCAVIGAQTPIIDSKHPISQALEHVLVTATKSGSVDLQGLPLAITAISADELDLSGIDSIKDLPLLAPGIMVSQNASYGQLYIRGIGTNNVFIGGDPSSTVHLNGAYLARPSSVLSEFLELERIEVLRGPQGTLYGRNSTGGTINIITLKPSEDYFSKISAELGNYDKTGISFFINGPLGTSGLAGNVGVSSKQRDGYINVTYPDASRDKLNDENRLKVQSALTWAPTNELTIELTMDYFTSDETPPTHKPTIQTSTGGVPPLSLTPARIDDPWQVALSTAPDFHEESGGANINLEWQINEYSRLSSTTSFRQLDFDLLADTDYSELATLITSIGEEQTQSSQEFRYNYAQGNFAFIAGLFYFEEQYESDILVQILIADRTVFHPRQLKAAASAAYVDVAWQFHPEWHASFGARYSREKKSLRGQSIITTAGLGIELPGNPDSENWSDFSPKVGLSYQPSEQLMFYATITDGFKSGGFNFSDNQTYEPEAIRSYEVGFKSEFADQHIRLNASAFYYDYTDLQVLSFIPEAGAVRISNAADAEISGLEVELLMYLNDQWRLSTNVTYLDAVYVDYLTRRANTFVDIDVSGNTLNSAPESSFSLVSDYTQSLSGGSILYRLENFWQDTAYFTAFNDSASSQKPYNVVNASVRYSVSGGQWQVQLYGKNLTNKAYTTASQDFSPTGVNELISPPRTFGIKGTYRFD